VLRYIHDLSAAFFYVLGSTFFLAYVLMQNKIWAQWPAWWLQVADLPLLLCAILYGATSLYMSIAAPDSKTLRYIIAAPLGIFFVWMMAWNFANVWWN